MRTKTSTALQILLAAATMALQGCDHPTNAQQSEPDQCIRAEQFQQCLKALPAEARKDARVELRVHPDTKAAWQAKADAAGLSLAAWIEGTLDRTKK